MAPKMPVPDDLLQMFARSPASKGCTVAYDDASVTITGNGNGKQVILTRPCTMPEIQDAAKEVKK